MMYDSLEHEQRSAPNITRRKLLTMLGAAGIAAATTGALTMRPGVAEASKLQTYNVMDYGAVGDGITDDTSSINQAITVASIAGGGIVHIPEGLYLVNPAASFGIVLKPGVMLMGEGEDVSVITAKPVGGSVIRRDFNPSAANSYLQDLYIAHLSIVLNHPATASPSNYKQIGFDFRNITRSTINECYVGNYKRGKLVKDDGEQVDMVQGYGIVFGNVSSGNIAYAGGEVNSAVRCAVWGAQKAIVIDDEVLSPISAAHGILIENCDVQACEMGIGNESRYTAGLIFENNIVQSLRKARGSSNTTYCYRVEGYGCKIEAGYIEASDLETDYIVYLGSLSKRNWVELAYYSSVGVITDAGSNNLIKYIHQTNGQYVESFNAVRQLKAWVKFSSTGSIVAGNGVASVTRTSAGDFSINWTTAYPTADYPVTFSNNVDTSGNAGLVTIRSQSTTNVRIHTYKIVSGTVTQQDFQEVTVFASLF